LPLLNLKVWYFIEILKNSAAVLSLPFSGVFGWKGILKFSRALLSSHEKFGIGSLSWLACGVLLMECLEVFIC
jgi:hypothetical protein